jgi:branched-subunit amino acid aminotransferase/4-amino-4-deoxychorismate lyase
LQITRGVARRDHAFPPPGTAPSVVVTARTLNATGNERIAADGLAVITVPDNRWARVDIKSISLLPNVLAKQAARERGAKEALTSASQIVMPVVRIDDRPVGNGAPGSVAVALRAEFHRHAEWA